MPRISPYIHSSMGYAVNYGAGIPGSFTSAPLAAPVTVGGATTLKFYLVDPAEPAWMAAQNRRLNIEIDAVDENGELLLAVAAGEWTVCTGTPRVCNTGPQPTAGTYSMSIPRSRFPPAAASRCSCAKPPPSLPRRVRSTAARDSRRITPTPGSHSRPGRCSKGQVRGSRRVDLPRTSHLAPRTYLKYSLYRSLSPFSHGLYVLQNSTRSASVGWLSRNTCSRALGRGLLRPSVCSFTNALAAA